MVAASFDSATVIVATESVSAITTAYRDGSPIATFPAPNHDCFGGGVSIAVAPSGDTAAVGINCSRPWYAASVPGTSIYQIATGALVQTLPGDALLSWDGSRFAQEDAVIWCR